MTENKPQKADKSNQDNPQPQQLTITFVPRKKKKKRKRTFRLAPLPPGRSTQFFASDPESPFSVKEIRSQLSLLFRAKGPLKKDFLFEKVDEKQPDALPLFLREEEEMERPVTLSATNEKMKDWELPEDEADEKEELFYTFKKTFIEYSQTKTEGIAMECFPDLYVLDHDLGGIYSDADIDVSSPENAKVSWEKLFGNAERLLRMAKQGAFDYIWIETDICYNLVVQPLVVQPPEKTVCGLLFSIGKPNLDDIFTEPKFTLDNEKTPPRGIPAKLEDKDVRKLLKRKVPELFISFETGGIAQTCEQGMVISNNAGDLPAEKNHEIHHALFSIAGLCSQISGGDFDVEYIILDSEDESIVMAQDLENELYLTGRMRELVWK